MDATRNRSDQRARHFRLILLWPLQLIPVGDGLPIQKHWELLEKGGENSPWSEVIDEIRGDPSRFQVRHYSEFVTFLPHVQRFLYGQGKAIAAGGAAGEPRVRVFRRKDMARARLTYDDDTSTVFDVAHVDLYFFLDIDIVILAFEIYTDDIELSRAQDTLQRFGQAYPRLWDEKGGGGNCPKRVEWLGHQGQVLAVSDYEARNKYLSFVYAYRTPRIASHWEYVLHPLVPDDSGQPGLIRYRQIEYHRMPVMGYLAFDDPWQLTRADFVRLVLLAGPAEADVLPYSERYLQDFEYRYCYDRFWSTQLGQSAARFMCSGQALAAIGHCGDKAFVDAETGVLGQFRHQHFLLFLITHFHKAALLMLSDRLALALNRLDIHSAESIRLFKRRIRELLGVFLRFTHRYWFHDISNQALAKDLFRMCADHLETDRLFAEVREEIEDMSGYLDSDSLRRQGNTIVRLTVVTTFGLVATVTTGFLGMNLIAAADSAPVEKLAYFLVVVIPTVWLILYSVVKSKRLSDFLEALSDDKLTCAAKAWAFLAIWKRKRGRPR